MGFLCSTRCIWEGVAAVMSLPIGYRVSEVGEGDHPFGPRHPAHSALETLRLRSGRAECPTPGDGMQKVPSRERG